MSYQYSFLELGILRKVQLLTDALHDVAKNEPDEIRELIVNLANQMKTEIELTLASSEKIASDADPENTALSKLFIPLATALPYTYELFIQTLKDVTQNDVKVFEGMPDNIESMTIIPVATVPLYIKIITKKGPLEYQLIGSSHLPRYYEASAVVIPDEETASI